MSIQVWLTIFDDLCTPWNYINSKFASENRSILPQKEVNHLPTSNGTRKACTILHFSCSFHDFFLWGGLYSWYSSWNTNYLPWKCSHRLNVWYTFMGILSFVSPYISIPIGSMCGIFTCMKTIKKKQDSCILWGSFHFLITWSWISRYPKPRKVPRYSVFNLDPPKVAPPSRTPCVRKWPNINSYLLNDRPFPEVIFPFI